MIGIRSYGAYIPRYRISTDVIAGVWGKEGKEISKSLGITQKSVSAGDEDAVTIALEAAQSAVLSGKISPSSLGALFVGSESHPYAVNPTSTIVGELLGVGHEYFAADLQFACKAGTAGMQAVVAMIGAKQIVSGMAIGSDAAQSKTHDVLEYTSAAGGAAYILAAGTDIAAELISSTSYSSDTPDFWRRDGIRYPSHAGRFTGEPAYFTHVQGAAERLFQQITVKPEDITHCVFHMPNGRFPREIAKRLGFSSAQLAPSLIVDQIGNPYSASTMIGLAAVLDIAKPGDTIFMVSYGSGAGSDGFFWRMTDAIVPLQNQRKKQHALIVQQLEQTVDISYPQYLKQTHKI